MLTERDLDTRANQGHDGVDDSSPTSGLSGSTLNNDSPPSEHHEDNWILRTAQDHSLQPHQQHHHLSPTVYYDDLHHEDSGDDQARLIEAAEEEEVSPRMENRELSPTVFYEPSIPPSDSATSASLHSSMSSMLNPPNLSISPNGRLRRSKTPARLHHPLVSGALGHGINRPPQGSCSPVANLAKNELPVTTDTYSSEVIDHHPPVLLPEVTKTNCEPSDGRPNASNIPGLLKRSRDDTLPEDGGGRFKRLRFENDVYALPSSPEPDCELRNNFSTATTVVNSNAGSPGELLPIDYERIVRIAIKEVERPEGSMTFTCHEHLLLQVSGLHDSSCFEWEDDMITLYPQEKIPHIKAKTIHYFIHWLYNNRFTNPTEEECGFRQLIELYYLGYAYAMTVLKNVVINHLIGRFSDNDIPSNLTKRMYKFTGKGDQLRRLWVDFYVWEVPDTQLLNEIRSGKVHPEFVQDLALAQMDKIRAMQVELTQAKPLPLIAPYRKARSAYHVRDATTGACCRRAQYEGEGYFHRQDEEPQCLKYERENASLRDKLERFRMRIEKTDIENLDLKRQLNKIREKCELLICNAGSKVLDHNFIDHLKLFRLSSFDHPDGSMDELVDCVTDRTSKRGKLAHRLLS